MFESAKSLQPVGVPHEGIGITIYFARKRWVVPSTFRVFDGP